MTQLAATTFQGTPPHQEKVTSTSMAELTRAAWKLAADEGLSLLNMHNLQVMWLAYRLAKVSGMVEQNMSAQNISAQNISAQSNSLSLSQVIWAGLLHDIGKVDLPPEIIHKTSALNPDERRVIQSHPMLGYHRLRAIVERHRLPGLDNVVLEAVLHHHERYNGTGYPLGLCGEEIPVLARILTIADVYSALVMDRPYRAAWSRTDALAYLHDNAGIMFDPVLVQYLPGLVLPSAQAS